MTDKSDFTVIRVFLAYDHVFFGYGRVGFVVKVDPAFGVLT
jgi:hypothetical protein